MPKSKTNPETISTTERRNFVLQLRKGGVNYRDIARSAVQRFGAEALPNGWDERYAYKDVMRALEQIRTELTEAVEDVREIELARLDAMFMGLWKQATSGHQGAIDRVLKIMDRRAKLVGLDAPTRTESAIDLGGAPLAIILDGGGPAKGDDE